jgi:site-specific recombinase XerD
MPETTPRAHIIGVSHDAPLQHHHYVQGYLYACEAEGKSPTTVVSYAENLSRFQALARELGLPSRPQDITRQHVRMFLAHLHRQGNSPATVNDRLAVLRLWFKWLKAEGIVGHDPTEGVGKVRQEKKVLKVLTPAQVQDLLAVCQRQGRKEIHGLAIRAGTCAGLSIRTSWP